MQQHDLNRIVASLVALVTEEPNSGWAQQIATAQAARRLGQQLRREQVNEWWTGRLGLWSYPR